MTTGCEAPTWPAIVEALAVVVATVLAVVSLRKQGKDGLPGIRAGFRPTPSMGVSMRFFPANPAPFC